MARILIMDDDVMIRWKLMNVLETLGHDVATASEGNEAMRLYKLAKESGEAFNLIIVDLVILEGKNGREFLEEVMQYDQHAKCIISSGYSLREAVPQLEFSDTFEFLPKPYKVADLCNVISRMA